MKFCPKIQRADNQCCHRLFKIYFVINALFTNIYFTFTFNGNQRSTENEHEKLGTPSPKLLFFFFFVLFFSEHHPKCCYFFLIASETCSNFNNHVNNCVQTIVTCRLLISCYIILTRITEAILFTSLLQS
jgi:hypothetical protein